MHLRFGQKRKSLQIAAADDRVRVKVQLPEQLALVVRTRPSAAKQASQSRNPQGFQPLPGPILAGFYAALHPHRRVFFQTLLKRKDQISKEACLKSYMQLVDPSAQALPQGSLFFGDVILVGGQS
jgi:hypothetical protein